MVNYFIVASSVLATAYVSAINGRHYLVAAVIALSEIAVAVAAYTIGRRQRRMATPAQRALAVLQTRIADRLEIGEFRIVGPPRTVAYRLAVRIMFGLVVTLSVGAVLYALAH